MAHVNRFRPRPGVVVPSVADVVPSMAGSRDVSSAAGEHTVIQDVGWLGRE
jgi:hypothetical protein